MSRLTNFFSRAPAAPSTELERRLYEVYGGDEAYRDYETSIETMKPMKFPELVDKARSSADYDKDYGKEY